MFLFILNLIITFLLLLALIPGFKRFFLDQPNNRSSHEISKPTAGGIIFVIVICIQGYLNNFFLPLICMPLSIVGLIDDKYDLKPKFRLFAQVLTIIALINFSLLKENWFSEVNIIFYLIALGVIIFSSTGCINFINFMDGLDGLLTSCMIIVLSFISLFYDLQLWPYIGSLLGFLILNWGPSKIFMGDVGSTFIGSLFVGLILMSDNYVDAFKILLLASPLLGDALISVIRRYFSGKSVVIPHNSFLFQRLHRGGLSHQAVTIIYSTATLAIGISFLIGNLKWMFLTIFIELLIAIYLEKKVAIKFD